MVEGKRKLKSGENDSYSKIISRVLSLSYNVSMVIIMAGLGMYIAGMGKDAVTVLQAGLLALLATPLLRVIASAAVFYFVEGDRRYTYISVTVFLILVVSIILGREV